MSINTQTPVDIDIVSDVICPWCYIGKRRLEAALRLMPHVAPRVRWRPFLLDPTLPPEGRERRAYLEAKFGGPARAAAVYARIADAGRDVGIPFAFESIAVTPDTRPAHALIRWTQRTGRQDATVERLFSLYFTQGVDISYPKVLTEIGEGAGLDPVETAAKLAARVEFDTMEAEIDKIRGLGVDAVPFFIFGGRFSISGAQAPDVLAAALAHAVETGGAQAGAA